MKMIKKFNALTINVNHKEQTIINFVKRDLEKKTIVCFEEDKLKDICNKYCLENNLNINNLNFQIKGVPINLESTIGQIINERNGNQNNTRNIETSERNGPMDFGEIDINVR